MWHCRTIYFPLTLSEALVQNQIVQTMCFVILEYRLYKSICHVKIVWDITDHVKMVFTFLTIKFSYFNTYCLTCLESYHPVHVLAVTVRQRDRQTTYSCWLAVLHRPCPPLPDLSGPGNGGLPMWQWNSTQDLRKKWNV